jgi:hypothetical protein
MKNKVVVVGVAFFYSERSTCSMCRNSKSIRLAVAPTTTLSISTKIVLLFYKNRI